jgi:hypothetical protein
MALEQKVETKIPNRLKIDRGFSFLPGRGDVPGRPGKYGTGGPGIRRSSGHVFPSPGTGSDYIRLQTRIRLLHLNMRAPNGLQRSVEGLSAWRGIRKSCLFPLSSSITGATT